MHSRNSGIGYLLMAIFCCLLLSLAAHAGEDDFEPTAENLWKAKQAGDLEKAARIKAILDAEAARCWGSVVHEETGNDVPGVFPPIRDDAFSRPASWGNDVTISQGVVSGGISSDYDNSGNVYAVRCSTHLGSPRARVIVYRSTDHGVSWSRLCYFYNASGIEYSYPVVLTGTDGDPDKLYVFYLRSSNNGDVRVARYTITGSLEDYLSVKEDSDTVTYFTVCANFGIGNRLMVAYEKERMGYSTPWLYTIRSTNRGDTWGDQFVVSSNGWHPDLGYGYGGYTYLVYTKQIGLDTDIGFGRSTDWGVTWGDFEVLTSDSWDDDFAKVAALHRITPTTQYVWVGYNHDQNNSGDWNMRFAYSTNAGVNWSKNHSLASDDMYDEIACDLWVARKTEVTYVNICYLRARRLSLYQMWFDIYWGFANTNNPAVWNDNIDVTEHWAALSYDGREVCQGTYPDLEPAGGWSGLVYAGQTPFDNFEGLYFDSREWTGVEEEPGQEANPREFTLEDNYPNPFNPHTRIAYFLPRACQVKLEVFNVLGQKIRTLVNEDQSAGNREVSWDGRNQAGEEVASGVYFYKLQAEEFTETKKMVLIR